MWFFKWLIIIGTTLALGFLSFAGTLILQPTWFGLSPLIWGVIAFGFSIVIEVLVIIQNINLAFKKLDNDGESYLNEALIVAILDDMAQKNTDDPADPLLIQYKTEKEKLEKADQQEDAFEPLDRILEPKAWKDICQTKKTLEDSVKKLETELIEKYKLNNPSFASELFSSTPEKAVKSSLSRELNWRTSRGGVFLIKLSAFFTGLSAMFAALYAGQTGLEQAYLSIAADTLTSWLICWPIAIFAGMGYGLLIYNNLMQLMHERKLHQDDQPSPHSRTYYIVCFLIVLLAFFGTASLFWTWWTSGTEVGDQMILFGSKAIIGIFAAFMAIPMLIWNLTNALNSVALLEKKWNSFKFTPWWNEIKETIKNAWAQASKKRNYQRFLNPFRLMENMVGFLCRGTMLAAHSISIGLSADKLGATPPAVVMAAGGTLEASTDIAYLLSHEHDQPSSSYERISNTLDETTSSTPSHLTPSSDGSISNSSPSTALSSHKPVYYQQFTDQDHTGNLYQAKKLPEAEHTHFDLAGILLAIILLVLKVLRFIWDMTFGLIGKICGLFCNSKEGWCDSIFGSFKEVFSHTALAAKVDQLIRPPISKQTSSQQGACAIPPGRASNGSSTTILGMGSPSAGASGELSPAAVTNFSSL